MAPLSPSLRLLVDEIHQTKNLSSERVIPIMGGMANKDWTDALLDRLAATRTRKEIEAYQVTARISRIALHIARHQAEVFGRFGLNRGEVRGPGALLLASPRPP